MCRFAGNGKKSKEGFIQGIDNLLNEVNCAAVSHERCTQSPPNYRAGEPCRNKPGVCVNFGKVDLVYDTPEHELGLSCCKFFPKHVVIGFSCVMAEEALHSHFVAEELCKPFGISPVSSDSEAYCGEPFRLGSPPEVPQWLQCALFFLLQKGCGAFFVSGKYAEIANELFRFGKSERCLQNGSAKFVAQRLSELLVHDNNHFGVFKPGNVVQLAFERIDMFYCGSASGHKTFDLGEVGRAVEAAV